MSSVRPDRLLVEQYPSRRRPPGNLCRSSKGGTTLAATLRQVNPPKGAAREEDNPLVPCDRPHAVLGELVGRLPDSEPRQPPCGQPDLRAREGTAGGEASPGRRRSARG